MEVISSQILSKSYNVVSSLWRAITMSMELFQPVIGQEPSKSHILGQSWMDPLDQMTDFDFQVRQESLFNF